MRVGILSREGARYVARVGAQVEYLVVVPLDILDAGGRVLDRLVVPWRGMPLAGGPHK